MPQDDNELAVQTQLSGFERLAIPDDNPFIAALRTAGVAPESIAVRVVPEYVAIELEVLCNVPSSRKGCNGESPLMVVTALSLFPEADDFEGYVGFFRAEAITEDLEHIAFTHYMFAKDTGERSPLYEYVEPQTPPFALKIAHMATRRGFSVYRPIPAASRATTS